MLARVLLRQDGGARLVKPVVATGMLEVPVSVDQLLDGVGVDAGQGPGNVWMCGDDFRADEQLSVGAGKHRDVSTSTQENADVTAESLNRDLRGGGFLKGMLDKGVFLGEAAWRKADYSNRHTSCSKKLAARDSG
jgi:hypothetical protein